MEKEYHIVTASNGNEALYVIQTQPVDLVILDIMMPELSGLQFLKIIRQDHYIPVLLLSAKSEHHDKILGLQLGADDYVSKPFNPLEVVARVQAMFRRVHQFDVSTVEKETESNLVMGNLVLDTNACMLYVSGEQVTLTSTEYKILKLLMESPGRLFTRKRIYEAVWEDFYMHEDNSIMVHISNIREKIELDSKKPEYLKTIRGLGYKMDAPMEN
ncbi:response regulator transcription factor [Neobacillus mesonae]|nr:response regulator transcription factor [Neobacillus mesonae]